ncbi:hypothetical protein I8748_31710 [Nostoc sp. CENA67]|uniref:Uncharacterized protein n=1 Tax=Amazonocrinis nigriterrae CENA67 TaxID=2794033 RepID=A0A8J7HVK2_9NOST|nr:hypothetical protein [Amazonocrinis nigriterrae]MBH8566667.1 hypothetical protein [Amazonocrinis nigriterrae CENA67]
MSQNNVASKPVSKIQLDECICCDLVTFVPLLFDENCQSSHNLRLNLTITFTESQLTIPLDNSSGVNIVFCIKRGVLELKLKNGKMDLHERNTLRNEIDNLIGIPQGSSEAPQWKFTLLNDENSKCLQGHIQHQNLGIIELLEEVGKYFELEAIFKIQEVNRNHIKIKYLDVEIEDKIQKENFISYFLNYLQEQYKLDNYVKKVIVTI